MMARAVGMGFLDDLLGSNVCYFEIGNLSDDPIEAAIFRQFKLVVAGEFSRPLEKADIDPGMKGVRWSFFPTPQADMPSGAAFALTTVNNVT
jgi:hypothetical protein